MTEAGLWAAFGSGFIVGGIFGSVAVLCYGKSALDAEQRSGSPPRREPTAPAPTPTRRLWRDERR
jgi:hypothetical protein